ncbi:phage gp6-like head-tail connector protein [Martelella alba]|uniref:Phage gp6-like head-tail connector protein n=1 Tax=Martelella alba TaxID=2590451 RepID=A0A506U6L4_9HYPH|nr:head-tail connector protein [Martelella alba]TPW28605.1 phage gp6-like head-tail connector protein [Martelella alba]
MTILLCNGPVIPTLVTAPADQPVTLDEAKAHLGVDFADDDGLIDAFIQAATAYLDGYRGVLGRCIMFQTWQIAAPDAGTVILPFPDIIAARQDGTNLTVTETGLGPVVTIAAAGNVTFDCQMPQSQLITVKAIVFMLVSHWYNNRAAGQATQARLPMAAECLIASLRWQRL